MFLFFFKKTIKTPTMIATWCSPKGVPFVGTWLLFTLVSAGLSRKFCATKNQKSQLLADGVGIAQVQPPQRARKMSTDHKRTTFGSSNGLKVVLLRRSKNFFITPKNGLTWLSVCYCYISHGWLPKWRHTSLPQDVRHLWCIPDMLQYKTKPSMQKIPQ